MDKSLKELHRFLSTPSARRATYESSFFPLSTAISIHALREEGDVLEFVCLLVQGVQFLSTPSARRATEASCARFRPADDFYPRPPRGGRRLAGNKPQKAPQFLSTPSARRATGLRDFSAPRHANFYPRPPRGGRPVWSSSM